MGPETKTRAEALELEDELDAGPVEEVLRALATVLRSYRLYGGNGPVLERFVGVLQAKLVELWTRMPSLRLAVEEQAIRWSGIEVYPRGEPNPELSFLFYKDGIRELTIFPGFEDEEAIRFLRVLGRAPGVRTEEDDLVTLLWQEDFSRLRYRYVDLTEAAEAGPPAGAPPPIDAAAVARAAGQPSAGFGVEDFAETLHFLDPAEVRKLEEEVRLEMGRDLWGAVITGLFDRLEDGRPERQVRIVRIMRELLPSMLGGTQLERVAGTLEELIGLASRKGAIAPDALRELRVLFTDLGSAETIAELIRTAEETGGETLDTTLGRFLEFLPPSSLAHLLQEHERPGRPDLKRVLGGAIRRLAERHRDEVVELVSHSDPAVAAAAARWVGRLGIGSAQAQLLRLLGAELPDLRAAAVEALQELRAASAGKALEGLLQDPDRGVRIAAARALAALEYTPAHAALAEAIQSKRLRAADRTEKIAFFECYGRVGGGQAVPLLEKMLGARRWIGRSEPTEIRACAALGLARTRHLSARSALTAAAADPDPVVRTAAARALKEAAW